MKHSFWDHYGYLDSPIHRLQPSVKILFVIFLIVVLSILPDSYLTFMLPFVFLLLTVILVISKIPIINVVKRTFVILPLILPVILLNVFFSELSLKHLFAISAKTFLSVLSLILLVSVSTFSDIMKTLSKWHFPKIMVMILSFMYRYFFLLTGEVEKMVRAVKLRSNGGKGISLFKIYAQVLAILFIKSYERAEKVYQAMLMRGYDEIGGFH